MKHCGNILGLFSVKCDLSQCAVRQMRRWNWDIFEQEGFCLGNQLCSVLLQGNKK